jgi:hypothetical protein
VLGNAWVQANFELAQEALNQEIPDRALALQHLGYAIHTLQDSTSPAHHDFQPWGIEGAQSTVGHIYDEDFNPGPGSNMYRATRDAYNWFFEDRKLPRGDIFLQYNADEKPKSPKLVQNRQLA